MKQRHLIIVIVIAALGMVSSMFYTLSRDNIENIVICSVNDSASYIPTSLCHYYLFKHRGTAADLALLRNNAGLGFFIHIEDKAKRMALMEFFIEQGLDVNGISQIDGLPPLHAAILVNDPQLLIFLLQKGANPLVKDRDRGLTAREFLALLKQKDPHTDRSKIEQHLKRSKGTASR